MTKGWDAERQKEWIERFRQAAILFHGGQFLNIRAMESAGSKAVAKLIKTLDAECPAGRSILIPLLGDEKAYVQVSAARYLILQYPDLTVPLLEQLKEREVTGAEFSALNILWDYRHGAKYL